MHAGRNGFWRLTGLLIAIAPAALGQVVTLDGSPGLYGTPYAYFGPQGARVWEQYRKHIGALTAQYPSVTVDSLAPDHARFQHIVSGASAPERDDYSSEGIFVGTSYTRRSYPDASLSIVQGSNLNGSDVRVGFVEHLADGGGASFADFVQRGGGEDGFNDLYRAQWGVDGVYLFFSLHYDMPNWRLDMPFAGLAGPESAEEDLRTNFWSQVVVTGATPDGPNLDTPYPTSMAVDVSWELVQSGAATSLVVQLGPSITLTWVFDDGVTRHGLTLPGNPDGLPYQNGSLDLEHVVPAFFLGSANQYNTEPFPEFQLEIAMKGSHLQIGGYPDSAQAGVPETFTVTALDASGQLDTGYAGTVHFASSDPGAVLPADYAFSSTDQGVHTFPAAFHHLGAQTLTVRSASTPSIQSTQSDIQIVARALDVGFNCDSAPGTALPVLGLACLGWMLGAARRRC